jgi:glycosyltransferase involved in cell wall biosynthesis
VNKLSIILPCYNESGNLIKIFERFREILKNRNDVDVILVNNGSTDDSLQIFERELKKQENSFARLVDVKINQGYGHGIMSGVREANAEFIAWTHADMQTDPNDVLKALELLEQQTVPSKSIVKGRRIARNPLDSFFTFGMSLISSIALSKKLYDINAQPKLFHNSFLEELSNAPEDFSLDLYLLYTCRTLNYTIVDLQVSFADRLHGESKGGGTMKGKLKLIKRTWAYIFKLKRELKND